MILGFLGKGGSGKSSLASQAALLQAEQKKNVLAVDADHNMDLSFNVTNGNIPSGMNYFGSGLEELQSMVGLTPDEKYSLAFLRGTDTRFSFEKDTLDSFTKKYSHVVSENIRLMAGGPQTDRVLYGQSCSHILTTPLKIYLPLLNIEKNDEVVVDEKAGADGVTTGIVTGLDVAVVVCEPALHSVKTAQQITELLDWYDTPYVVAGNKIAEEDDVAFIEKELGQKLFVHFSHANSVRREPGALADAWKDDLSRLYDEARKQSKDNRLERTIKKFQRNAEHHKQ